MAHPAYMQIAALILRMLEDLATAFCVSLKKCHQLLLDQYPDRKFGIRWLTQNPRW